MFKSFFTPRQPEDTVDLELEHSMQMIHNRMERMLQAEDMRRLHCSILEKVPTCYRSI